MLETDIAKHVRTTSDYRERLYLFAILDKVSGKYESWGVYANKSIAARVLVATYAFNAHPAINKRLADFDLVQIGGVFGGIDGELIPKVVENCGSLQQIKAIFDIRDGVFALPDAPDVEEAK